MWAGVVAQGSAFEPSSSGTAGGGTPKAVWPARSAIQRAGSRPLEPAIPISNSLSLYGFFATISPALELEATAGRVSGAAPTFSARAPGVNNAHTSRSMRIIMAGGCVRGRRSSGAQATGASSTGDFPLCTSPYMHTRMRGIHVALARILVQCGATSRRRGHLLISVVEMRPMVPLTDLHI